MPKSEITRQRILDAAIDLFREKGFEDTTMRMIALRADMAVGAAYYYFQAKEDLVLAFYERARVELRPKLEEAMARNRKLESRLRGLIEVKLAYFAPNRQFLGALMATAADPQSPLSPFSEATRAIREEDTAWFTTALSESGVKVPDDLKSHLPRLLWLYQMGLILYWIYDRSEGQHRTANLLEKSLAMVVGLIRLASVPLLRPLGAKSWK